eukprot:Em0014g321a
MILVLAKGDCSEESAATAATTATCKEAADSVHKHCNISPNELVASAESVGVASVQQNWRYLDEQYPHFSTEKDFINNLLSSVDISLQKQGGGLYMLTQFVLERPQLQAGGRLLPDLVEFYLWLHSQLAYIVSYDRAAELKIGTVVKQAVKRYSKDVRTRVERLYERVKVGYNAYVKTIGHTIGAEAYRGSSKVCKIVDELPLLHFLSEEKEGNDWLYIVIADIVNTHNNFIQGVYTMAKSQCLSVYHLLPSDPPKIPLTEFTLSHCIVGRKSCLHEIDDFLQMVRSRYTPHRAAFVPEGAPPKPVKNPMASVSGSVVQQHTPCQFDLHLIQQDVIATYLAGKPLVESAAAIRTHFKFSNMAQHTSAHPVDIASSGGDIDTLKDQLPDHFKVQCDDLTSKKMEFDFHSAGYLTLLEAVQAIKNVLGHLINSIKGNDQLEKTVKSQTIRQFVSKIHQNAPVFDTASTPTLSPPQLTFLENLPTIKLLDELKDLTDNIARSEAYFTKNIDAALKMPVKKALEDFQFISQDDALPKFIPDTICVQHYVAFRVVLRRLVATVQNSVADCGQVEVEEWQEFIGDIWDKRLPHFRDFSGNGGTYLFKPRKGTYGCGDGQEGEDERSQFDVMDNDIAAQDPPMGHNKKFAVNDRPMRGNKESAVNDRPMRGNKESAINDRPMRGNKESPVHDRPMRGNKESPVHDRPMRGNADTAVAASDERESVHKEKRSLEELVDSYTVDDVVGFLHSIKMDQYIEAFKSKDIDGTTLVEFGEDEFKELGISSHFHCFKIQFLFKRTLQCTQTTHDLAFVRDFLAANKMDNYTKQFNEERVDGDMLNEILQLPDENVNAILGEIGVASKIDRIKLRKKFKLPK